MIRVLMAAPFEANGRFRGGINAIANSVLEAQDSIYSAGMEIIPFNTCRIDRSNSDGKITLENIYNFSLIYRDVIEALNTNNPDVFYLHTSRGMALLKDLLVLRHVKKTTGCKTVMHIHFAEINEILTGKKILDKWILSALDQYADGIVFLSTRTREQFVARGMPCDKCHVIYNFSTLTYQFEELFGEKQTDEVNFLFVGSIDSRKGIFDAMEILSSIAEPFTLHVCGGFRDFENEERFSAYREKNGEKLHFHGFVKDNQKREVFKQADVLLLPSYGEGLPVVILEAFSAGCGVVSTNVGAIPEIVKHENGIVIEPGDKQAIKDAILHYMHVSKQALQAQQQGNFKLAEQYTLDVFIRKMADVCRHVSE